MHEHGWNALGTWCEYIEILMWTWWENIGNIQIQKNPNLPPSPREIGEAL
jgi:hypothetical protein